MAASFEMRIDYQQDPSRRKAFHRFAEATFEGISFRHWDAAGGWTDAYHVASYFDGLEVAANVSVSELEVIMRGERRRAVQFATVGTRPEHRKQGLSDKLMRYWLDRMVDDETVCFLFANESVLDFYPRFGFRRVEEHRFGSEVDWPAGERRTRKLDAREPSDCALLMDLAERRAPVTRAFGCADYGFILLFYLQLGYPAPFYHIVDDDAIVVADWRDGQMDVYDIVAPHMDAAVSLLMRTADEPIRQVVFHFTPELIDLPTKSSPLGDDSIFFARGAFPIEGERFKFPFLAQT